MTSTQSLLEPEIGVWIRVEGRNLGVPRAPIEADRFRQRAIRLQPKRRHTELARFGLEREQHPSAQPGASRRLGDPHPLERSHVRGDQLHAATCHWLAVNARHEYRA